MTRPSRHQKSKTARHRPSAFALLALLVLAATTILSACAPSAQQVAAQNNRAKLDQELGHARNDLGIPESMLQPIEKQEAKIANGEGGWNYNYQDAASNYALLLTQLTGVEQTAGDTLKKQTGLDLQAFATALEQRQQDGFIEAGAYQARLSQAQQAFTNAKTPGDYVKVDTLAKAQTAALDAMGPAYQKLTDFQGVLKALGSSGINTNMAQTEYDQDLQAFRNAGSADSYQTLQQVIDGQILQLMADQSEGLPYIGSALLDSFQARIDLLKSYGGDVNAYQQQHDTDAKALAAAHSLSDYQKLAQTLNTQVAAMSLPLIKGKAYHDLATLKSLVNTAYNNVKLAEYDPAQPDYTAGRALYEYELCPTNGLQDVTNVLNQAQTQDDYQASDDNIMQLLTNARAYLDNMNDKTPAGQPHATDLQLMKGYGLMQGRVMVTSLREQVARFYQDGKLVYWTYVTTGRIELPSVPGLHTAMYKVSPTVFSSSEPKGSPFWYAPTPINYAILYANYGFFVHDGWWRTEFGPTTNLPHYDPAAFDGGSHGCINLPLQNMKWVYSFIQVGDPILVY